MSVNGPKLTVDLNDFLYHIDFKKSIKQDM